MESESILCMSPKLDGWKRTGDPGLQATSWSNPWSPSTLSSLHGKLGGVIILAALEEEDLAGDSCAGKGPGGVIGTSSSSLSGVGSSAA